MREQREEGRKEKGRDEGRKEGRKEGSFLTFPRSLHFNMFNEIVNVVVIPHDTTGNTFSAVSA